MLISLTALTGCTNSTTGTPVQEINEPAYVRGKQFLRENRPGEALSAFLKVIEMRQKAGLGAPEANLEAGYLMLKHVQDPIGAIYHFREYIRLLPESPKAPLVQGKIAEAERLFARKLPGNSAAEGLDPMDLMDLLKQVREENARLKRALAGARQGQPGPSVGFASSASTNANPAQFAPPPPATNTAGGAQVRSSNLPTPTLNRPAASSAAAATGGRVYVVQGGDSLYKIAQQQLGAGTRWEEIFEANRSVLKSPQALKPGMELRLP